MRSKLKVFANLIRTHFFYYFIAIRALFTPKPRSQSNEILLVVMDKIGDFLLWTSSVPGYREAFPGKRLVLLVSANLAELAEAMDLFDEVIPIEHHVPYSLISFNDAIKRQHEALKDLWCRRFDVAIMPGFGKPFTRHAILLSTNAREKITVDGNYCAFNPLARYLMEKLYTRIVTTEDSNKMELILNADFVRSIGAKNFKAALPVLPKFESQMAGDLKKGFGEYIVVVAGASTPWRRWQIDRLAQVVRHVWTTYQLPCVMVGTEAESTLAEEIIGLVPEVKVRNLCGKTKLKDLSAIIGNAKMYIGNDTGSLHIAVANGTPSVCVAAGIALTRFVNYKIESEENGNLLPYVVPFNFDCKCAVVERMDSCHRETDYAQCVHSIGAEDFTKVVDEVYMRIHKNCNNM